MIVGSCPSSDQLTEYSLGTLTNELAQEMESHLEHCSQCVKAIALLETRADILTGLLSKQPEPDEIRYLAEETYLRAVATVSSLSVSDVHDDLPSQGLPKYDKSLKEALQPGRRLGQYVLLELVGKGGMGLVFRARHEKLGHIVALKVLSLPRVHEPRIQERFRREMQAAGMIEHPNVVRAIYSDESNGIAYLVMEFVDGLDLSALLKRHKRLSFGHACEMIRMAAMGLQAIHQAGMVHRDLKPGNIMLARDGQVKILDLGLALLNPQLFVVEGELTESGQLMGTIDYMAPEQADDTRRADFRADIYGLGATLMALLTGKPPFGDRKRSLLQKLSMLANQSAPSLKEQWPDAPLGLSDIVAKMLARDPANRFQSASDITTALTPFCQRDGLTEMLPDRSTRESDFTGVFPDASVACTLEDTLILDRSRDRQSTQSPAIEERQRPLSSDDAGKRIRRWIRIGLILVLAASSLTLVFVSFRKPQLAPTSSIVANADPGNVPGDPLSKTRDASVSSSEPDVVATAPTLRLPVDAALAEIATKENSPSIHWTIFGSDATPDDRADAIHLAKTVVPIAVLLKHYQAEARPSVRAGLLLAISEYDSEAVIAVAGGLFGGRSEFLDSLYYSYVNDPDAEVHSCLDFLLRYWGHDEMLERLRPLLEQKLIPFEGGWFRPFHVSTMVVIPGPRTELLGPDPNDRSAGTVEGSSSPREATIPYSFAIATTEVTRYQFWRLSENFWETLPPDNPNQPVNKVRWNQAAEFCNRLTELDGIPASQQCYILAETANGKFWRQKPDALELSGYRLPTDDEWEIACRAGSRTLRPFGDTTERMSKYVSALEQPSRPKVVGHRKPNAFGLFDMLGNVSEWIHTIDSEVDSLMGLRRLRGGSAWTSTDQLISSARFTGDANQISTKMGFRVARSLVPSLQDAPKFDNDIRRLELQVGPPACTEELRKYVDSQFQTMRWKQVIRVGNWNVWTPVKRMLRLRNISADDVTFVDGHKMEGYFKFEPAIGSTIKGHSSADFGVRMEPQGATGERSQLLHFWWGEERVYDFEPFTLHGCFDGPLVDLFDIGSFDVPAKMNDLGILPMNSQAGRTCYVRNVGGIPVQVQVTDVRGPFKLESPFDKTLRPHGLDHHFRILIAPNATGPLNGEVTLRTIENPARSFTFPVRATAISSDQFSSLAIFRKGTWLIDHNCDAIVDKTIDFGEDGDQPLTGDWNGDGICDLAVWRRSPEGITTVEFQLRDHLTDGVASKTSMTIADPVKDVVAADRDGDGISEIGLVASARNGVDLNWVFDTKHDGTFVEKLTFGLANDDVMIGDWNGDGHDDIAVSRPGEQQAAGRRLLQFIRKGQDSPTELVHFSPFDKPIAGDWDGDGDDDPGCWRPEGTHPSTWQFETNGDSVSNYDLMGFGTNPNVDKPVVLRNRSRN